MALDAQIFRYTKLKDDFDRGRKVSQLCSSDRVFAQVQLIKEGGETRLHSHAHWDGVWMVLSGKARFYGADDVLLGEFGKHEGVLIPRDFKYWFESASDDEPLELLQIETSDIEQEVPWYGKSGTNVVERADATVRTVPG